MRRENDSFREANGRAASEPLMVRIPSPQTKKRVSRTVKLFFNTLEENEGFEIDLNHFSWTNIILTCTYENSVNSIVRGVIVMLQEKRMHGSIGPKL